MMKNIWKLFRNDIEHIRKSVIGMIVMVGLVIVPVLYAWFNIAGSWDPYGNTGNLKVAVANEDEGYLSDLVPIKVNIGDSVVSSLRANDALDWEFVNEDDAIEGVKAGTYYAAVVIPEDFSANMMTLFSTEVKHSGIIYYENQKANAIAPRVTDKGASTIRQQIDETFTSTVGDIGLATSSTLLDFMSGDEVVNFIANLSATLDTGIESLRDAATNTGTFANLVGSASGLMDSTGTLLSDSGTTSEGAAALLADARDGLVDIQNGLGGATSAINEALKESASSYDSVSSAVDTAFATVGKQSADTQQQLQAVASEVGSRAAATEGLAQDVRDLDAKLPEGALKPSVSAKLQAIATKLDAVAQKQRQLEAALNGAASDLSTGTADIEKSRQDIKDLIADAKASITQVKTDYEDTLKGQAGALASSVESIASASTGIASGLDETVDGLSAASHSLAKDLTSMQGVLGDAAQVLTSSADDLQQVKAKLDLAAKEGDIQQIRFLIGDDPEALAHALAAPVGLDKRPVYHIANYGSAMAPFYTILSLWVGGIVLAAMLKVGVDDRVKQQLAPVRLHELYLGRFMLFALLALCQSTLVCAGDILFFEIQCLHPWQFMLTGWLASFVFCNIIYTLTVSFGDIGKALAVVLLVMQVAGSGGTFPIEMTADFFQAVYPFLPFTHGINAMHAAMAGAYGAEYWIEMGLLASYLIPSLALGLVFRRPVIRANNWIIEKLEETKLM